MTTRSSSISVIATTVAVTATTTGCLVWWWWRSRILFLGDKATAPTTNIPPPPRTMLEFEKEATNGGMSDLARVYVNHYDGQGNTLQAAREYFNKLRLLPRILTGDLTHVDTELNLFGGGNSSSSSKNKMETLSLPVIIAPTAFHNLVAGDEMGEIATARGAGRAGAAYTFNWMLSSKEYTQVIAEPGVKWLQMYLFEERDMVQRSVELALESRAFSAILLTCDHPHQRVQHCMVPQFRKLWPSVPAPGSDRYKAFMFPNQVLAGGSPVTIGQLVGDGDDGDDGNKVVGTTGTNSYKLSWKDVEWVQSIVTNYCAANTSAAGSPMQPLPIVIKGVLSPLDAERAIQAGASAIVVSNHGGRQFDGAPPAIEMLPAVVATVKGRIPVLLDSGIRTSTDIVKALCLGAAGVLLGRPALWALSCGGAEALQRMLDQLRSDIANDMRSLGFSSIQDLNMSCIHPPDRERIELTRAQILKYHGVE